jgi:hypothetical protein
MHIAIDDTARKLAYASAAKSSINASVLIKLGE